MSAANKTEIAANETAAKPARKNAKKPAAVTEAPKSEQTSAEESSASTQPAPEANEEQPSAPEQPAANPPAPEKEAEKVEGWDTEPAERPKDAPRAVQLSSGVKQVVQAVVHDCPATLADIEVDIKKQMVNIANSFLRIGGLLIISKEFFDKQEKFLNWSEEKFGIKKAQVYKLMKVHTEFGEDARFKGVAMRVLDMLTGAPESVKAKAAETVAATGKLETKTAEALIAAEKNQGAVIDAATGAQAEPLTLEQLDSIVTVNPEAAGVQPDGEPSAPPAARLAETIIEVTEAPKSELAQLNETINKLMDELGNLRAENEALKNPKKRTGAAAPMLKQFKHTDPCIVLGISQEESKVKKEVKGAVRELSAIWNNDTNAEAWALISSAADALLKEAK